MEVNHSYGASEPVVRLGAYLDENDEANGLAMCSHLTSSSGGGIRFDLIGLDGSFISMH